VLAFKEEEVALRRLDSYLAQIARELERPPSNADGAADSAPRARVLIKIDTEGSECEVLRGARCVIEKYRPVIVFECFPGERRKPVMDYFAGVHYDVFSLPWRLVAPTQPLASEVFLTNRATNFLAMHRG